MPAAWAICGRRSGGEACLRIRIGVWGGRRRGENVGNSAPSALLGDAVAGGGRCGAITPDEALSASERGGMPIRSPPNAGGFGSAARADNPPSKSPETEEKGIFM